MDVSVIIVNWNTRDLLRSCLDSIYAQAGKYKFEIIVVDNASKDDSCEMVRQFFPEVILIANSTNKGYAGAVNKGLRIARGRYFLILNSDILICDSAIEKTISYANKHLEAAVVGCQVMEDNEKVHMTCRRFPSTLNLLLDTFGLNRIFRMNRFFGREYMWWWPRDSEREVDVISGMFMLVRRQAVDEVGFMDESFFFLFEETDWCYRFSKAGWKMLFWPGARIIHVHGGRQSRKKANFTVAVQFQKSMLIFFRKHYGGASCFIARVLLTIQSIFCFSVWVILRLYRNLRGKNNQYADKKIRDYWWVLLSCLINIEPDSGGFKQFTRKIADTMKDSIKTFFAILYWVFSHSLRKSPTKVVLYYHAMKQKDIARFESQMKYLVDYCHVVKASDIKTTLQNGTKPVVAVTFDDALVSFQDHALPVLRHYGLVASIAVPIGFMDRLSNWSMDNYLYDNNEVVLNSNAITDLDRLGYEIFSHTMSHRNLTQITNTELKMELYESKHMLEQILGHEVSGITYPYGAYNATVCEVAAEAGYRIGFSIEPRTIYQSANPLCIGRFKVSPSESLIQFKLKVHGAYQVVALLSKFKYMLTGRKK